MKTKRMLVETDEGLALLLPQDLVERFALRAGDTIDVNVSPHGLLVTVPVADERSEADVGREFMREYRDTFRDLAKQ